MKTFSNKKSCSTTFVKRENEYVDELFLVFRHASVSSTYPGQCSVYPSVCRSIIKRRNELFSDKIYKNILSPNLMTQSLPGPNIFKLSKPGDLRVFCELVLILSLIILYCFCIVVVLCLNCIVIGSSANPLKRGSDV